MPLSDEQKNDLASIRAHATHSSQAGACTEDIHFLLSIIDTLQGDVEHLSWATIEHKEYTAVAAVDFEGGIIYGHVEGAGVGLSFQGESVKEAADSFRETVDDIYLEWCAESGREPGTPSVPERVKVKTERNAAIRAAAQILLNLPVIPMDGLEALARLTPMNTLAGIGNCARAYLVQEFGSGESEAIVAEGS